MLTKEHKGAMVATNKDDPKKQGEKIKKPDVVVDYDINMLLVDKCDRHVGFTECVRGTIKWYKKVFFHLVDVSMLNAFYLWQVKTGNRTSLRLFDKGCIKEMLDRWGTRRSTTPAIQTHTPTPVPLDPSEEEKEDAPMPS